MPASRQRTENWRKCLWQVYERGGALEISLPRADSPEGSSSNELHPDSSNLIWRVKVLGISDDDVLIESPSALGKAMALADGAQLIAAIVIGQNRWMFHTSVLEHVQQNSKFGKTTAALRLRLPDKVERCSRRNFYRISTVELNLPQVRCWPLIDPTSALVAEQANREHVRSVLAAREKRNLGPGENQNDDEAAQEFIEQLSLPEVGPPFDAALANIGGGGIGIVVDPEAARHFGSKRVFWMQFALPPEIPVPIAVTAKLVHTHIDSTQKTYAGLAFDFSRSRDHEQFMTEQLTCYVEMRQRAIRRRAA